MRKIFQSIIVTSLILALLSCNYSENSTNTTREIRIDTLETIIGNNWNIDINDLYTFNNQPLYFRNKTAYFFDDELGRVSLSRDTLSITGYRNMTLVGIIETITDDTLKIKKIQGNGRPFAYDENFVFYNDKLIDNKDFKIDKVVYATSLCYGSCPEMAIEISSNNIYKFYGGKYSEFKGNYIGTIEPDFFKKIEYELRFLIIQDQHDFFELPMDAPMCELIIYYNDGMRKMIAGYSGHFPIRLNKTVSVIYNSYKYANFEKVEKEIQFETYVHNIVPPPPPPPPPPSQDY